MVITNQKPIINTQKIKRKEPKHNTKERHHTKRKESKKRRKEQRRTTKTPRKKLKKGNKYILINSYFNCQWTKCSNQKA